MTHYEQCCARECEWCAKGCDNNFKFNGRHYAMLDNFIPVGEGSACTAPTLAQFAERCAEALTQIAKPALGGKQQQWIARRALGLEKG